MIMGTPLAIFFLSAALHICTAVQIASRSECFMPDDKNSYGVSLRLYAEYIIAAGTPRSILLLFALNRATLGLALFALGWHSVVNSIWPVLAFSIIAGLALSLASIEAIRRLTKIHLEK